MFPLVLAAGSYTDAGWDSGRPAAAGQARRTGRLTAAPRPLVVGGGLIRGDSGRGLLLAAVAVAGLWGPVKE